MGRGKRCLAYNRRTREVAVVVERQSERVVVVPIGVQHNAPGAKGPHFIDAREGAEGRDECRIG